MYNASIPGNRLVIQAFAYNIKDLSPHNNSFKLIHGFKLHHILALTAVPSLVHNIYHLLANGCI